MYTYMIFKTSKGSFRWEASLGQVANCLSKIRGDKSYQYLLPDENIFTIHWTAYVLVRHVNIYMYRISCIIKEHVTWKKNLLLLKSTRWRRDVKYFCPNLISLIVWKQHFLFSAIFLGRPQNVLCLYAGNITQFSTHL